MNRLTLFGLAAVTLMLVFYTLEKLDADHRLEQSVLILIRQGCYASHIQAFHKNLCFDYLSPHPRFRLSPGYICGPGMTRDSITR